LRPFLPGKNTPARNTKPSKNSSMHY